MVERLRSLPTPPGIEKRDGEKPGRDPIETDEPSE